MAIAIEQEKKPVNIIGILVGVVVVLTLFGGVYFFLFKQPELIDVVLPNNLQNLNAISNVQFAPEKIVQSEKYKVLRRYESEVPKPAAGKSNPFLP